MSGLGMKTLFSGKSDAEAQLAAINRSQAVIEFDLTGKILNANENFLAAVGYTLAEVKGQHHSMFVDPVERQSPAYRQFWEQLARGEFFAAQFRRFGKGGREIWIEASYNPILDASGKPYKVVKFATDITQARLERADFEGQLAAINKAQAVIEFDLTGKILHANENFLGVVGYSLAEVVGQHHRMFVDPAERESADYHQFWDKLRKGEYEARQYRRIAKGGKEVWIQASYNPILDASGRPYKVVKFATDITAQIKAAQMMQVSVEQAMRAVREKDLTVRVSTDGMTGELKTLCGGINELLDALTDIVTAVRDSSEEATSASTVISNGSRDLAMRTEQQASSLEETSATTEQLSASVKQSAGHARKATQLGGEARSVAEHGGRVITDAVEAMARIDKASKNISDIISVIDGIAFQTNLLALNAAVEAARAGDAGRGFAVVASEVRALAQRSAEAAKDIKGLIVDCSEQVEGGVRLVQQAGTVLGEIVESVSRVASNMEEISTATTEQAKGIEEISSAVAHLDEITQQNSGLAEQSAATAHGLQEQLEALKGLIVTYKTGREAAPAQKANPVAQLQQRARVMAAPVSAPARKPKLAAGGAGRSLDWDEF